MDGEGWLGRYSEAVKLGRCQGEGLGCGPWSCAGSARGFVSRGNGEGRGRRRDGIVLRVRRQACSECENQMMHAKVMFDPISRVEGSMAEADFVYV